MNTSLIPRIVSVSRTMQLSAPCFRNNARMCVKRETLDRPCEINPCACQHTHSQLRGMRGLHLLPLLVVHVALRDGAHRQARGLSDAECRRRPREPLGEEDRVPVSRVVGLVGVPLPGGLEGCDELWRYGRWSGLGHGCGLGAVTGMSGRDGSDAGPVALLAPVLRSISRAWCGSRDGQRLRHLAFRRSSQFENERS